MAGSFATTRWSLIAAAAAPAEPAARRALAELCQAYWRPVYAYLRHRGERDADAQDLTQGFFARLLEREDLRRAEAGRGRFRSWLLTCVQHYVANERRAARAEKRGGGHTVLQLPFAEAERDLDPRDGRSPEWHFTRAWAVAVLERAMAALEAEHERAGKIVRFRRLRAVVERPAEAPPYRELAAELDTTEGSIKVFVHRLRQQLAERVRQELADTVAVGAVADLEVEVAELFDALGRPSCGAPEAGG
ncbi:MAG: sigma-70 family RNA polymerase sigma factor [Planctomycetota bacterium]